MPKDKHPHRSADGPCFVMRYPPVMLEVAQPDVFVCGMVQCRTRTGQFFNRIASMVTSEPLSSSEAFLFLWAEISATSSLPAS